MYYVYAMQVCKTTCAGIQLELCNVSKIAKAEKEHALETSALERNWLRRGKRTKASLWKPKTLHRLQAMRWLCSLDKQFNVLTGFKGLAFFKMDANAPQWRDWRTWPSACLPLDLGSDGCSGLHGAIYFEDWKLNVDGMQDHSHGGSRSVYNAFHKCGLYGLVLLSVVSFNLPFGPDSEDLRQRQIQETMKHRYQHTRPQDAVLFQHLLPRIIHALRKLGHAFQSSGGRELEDEVWAIMAERSMFL